MNLSLKKEPFPLEDAAWPVLTLSMQGNILSANPAARKHFFTPAASGALELRQIWSNENGCSAGEFMKRVSTASTASFPIKLRVQGGDYKAYSACICPWIRKRDKVFIAQFLPRTGAQTPSGETVFLQREALTETGAPAGANSSSEQQKLQCAMQLTRTVAMDFNNALTSILGHTTLLLNKLAPGNPHRGYLAQIEKAVERAAHVAFDLASFSQEEKEMFPPAAANLNKLLRRIVEKCRLRAPTSVTWRTNYEPRLNAVTIVEPKIQQAFEKVFENAAEATPPDGTITITSANRRFEVEQREGKLCVPPGNYVLIEINDSGPGIPPENLARVMDPFFTTKEGHRGLGMAWAYGIITTFSGHLSVGSAPGQGTTVRIYLPAATQAVDDTLESEEDLTGEQTILMVDDEELLLTMGEMVLSSYGYRVLTAANGRQALDLMNSAEAPPIDLVVTDLVMPHMDGYDLIKNLQSQKPGLRIICTSGNYRPSNRELGITYLQKPFNSMDLARAVKRVLGGNGSHH